jgi:hypothetical protein
MKNCKRCFQNFKLNQFYPKKGGKFGVDSICKVCDRSRPKKRNKEAKKLYYQNNKEKIDLKNRNWVINNREKTRQYMLKYCRNNKEKLALKSKIHRLNNPEKSIEVERKRYYKYKKKLLLKNTIYRKITLMFLLLNRTKEDAQNCKELLNG